MYFNIKSKYKKLFWILIGFILSCIYVHKVYAYNYYGLEIDQQFLNNLWSKIEGKTPNDLDYDSFNSDYVYHQSDYPYVSCSRNSRNTYIYSCEFFKDISLYSTINSSYKDFSIYFQNKTDNIVIEYLTNTNTINTGCHTQILGGNGAYKNYYWTRIYTQNSSYYYKNISVTNFTIPSRITSSFDYDSNPPQTVFTVNFHINGGNVIDLSNPLVPNYINLDYQIETTTEELEEYLGDITIYKDNNTFVGWYYDANFTEPYTPGDTLSSDIDLYAKWISNLPDYLQGYTEITLEPGERYIIFSSSTISSGSVYIPLSDFNDYGSRISYFDKDIDTQPYTSYIQDFSTTPDGLYAKQNFDLSTYNGADFIMFSKYIYLEGQDNFSSSVWVPSEMYSSIVEITPNNTGGNDFDFSYVDSNGDLQAQVISSSDLSQGSPLVSDLFTNFTTKDYGLSSIITAPIPLLQTLNNSSCSTLELPINFDGIHDKKLILPCMTPVYSSTFGQLFTLYQTITTGLVAYFIGLAYFNKIKQLKDPDNDSIEVVDL